MIRFLPSSFFKWCAGLSVSQAISKSMWGFAVIETIHIIGLTMLLGSIFVLNLRVLGYGVKQPADKLAKEIFRVAIAGFAIIIVTGILMFMSAATTYMGSDPFAIKLGLLTLAIVMQFAMHKIPGMYAGGARGKVLAGLAMLCWFGVAYAGRGIAFEILLSPTE
jgi:hypothetical protein